MFTSFGVVSMATLDVKDVEVDVSRCETFADTLVTSSLATELAAVAVAIETTGEDDNDEAGADVSVTRGPEVDEASSVELGVVAADNIERTVELGDRVVVGTI